MDIDNRYGLRRHLSPSPRLAPSLLSCGLALMLVITFAAPVAAQQVLEFTAMDFAFRGPSQGTAGLTTIRLRNTGQKLHHVQLMRLEDGKRLAELFPVLYANKGLHGAPAWAQAAGGPSAALPGQTIEVRQRLTPGRYAVICWIPAPDGQAHFMKGMMTELEIVAPPAGTAVTSAEPRATLRVTLSEYRATLSQPLSAGAHTLRIENTGRQDHEFLLVRLKPGRSAEDIETWSGAGQLGAAPMEEWVGLAGIAPRGVAWLDVTLRPGRYAIICLSPDRGDGRPHAHHGFRQVVDVR